MSIFSSNDIRHNLEKLIANIKHHEHLYPVSDGEGAAGDPVTISTNADDETHAAATTKDFWGEPIAVVPVSTLTENFDWIGVYIYATTTGKTLQWAAYKVDPIHASARDGGNAWDETETVLTVTDGSEFQTNDLVWIFSTYKTDGEIVRVTGVVANVVTVERETSQFGAPNTGLRWDHTTNAPGTEVMYLAHRESEDHHVFESDFSAASNRDMKRYEWHSHREMSANAGIIIRNLNGSDGVSSTFDIRVIYENEL